MQERKSKLKQLREDCYVTQDGLIHSAGDPPVIGLSTYRKAERGETIRYNTAKSILALLNICRVEAGRELLALEDLDLNIR